MTGDLAALKESLSRTPFFGGLEDAALEQLIGMLRPRLFAPGEIIVREGELGKSMFIIQSGHVLVCSDGESGHSVHLVRLRAGDFFGEMALIAVQPRSSTVRAETAARLLELTNMDLYRLYLTNVQAYVMILQNINRELCRRLRSADHRITQLADEAGDEVTQMGAAFSPAAARKS